MLRHVLSESHHLPSAVIKAVINAVINAVLCGALLRLKRRENHTRGRTFLHSPVWPLLGSLWDAAICSQADVSEWRHPQTAASSNAFVTLCYLAVKHGVIPQRFCHPDFPRLAQKNLPDGLDEEGDFIISEIVRGVIVWPEGRWGIRTSGFIRGPGARAGHNSCSGSCSGVRLQMLDRERSTTTEGTDQRSRVVCNHLVFDIALGQFFSKFEGENEKEVFISRILMSDIIYLLMQYHASFN